MRATVHRVALAGVAALALGACGLGDRFFAPVPRDASIALRLSPSLSATDAAAMDLVDHVHVVLTRETGAVLVDTTVLWPVSATQLHVLLPVKLQSPSELVTITIDLQQRALVLARGTTTITAVQGASTPADVTPQFIVTFLAVTTIDAPGFIAAPTRVNGGSTAAGRLLDSSGNFRGAFVWTGGKSTTVTGPGGRAALINGLNEQLQLVGQYDNGTTFHALLWQNGAGRDLGVVAGYDASSALDINGSGLIVGSGYHNSGTAGTVPLVWRNLQLTQLQYTGSATSVNDAGTIVGIRTDATGGNEHAVIIQSGTAPAALPDSGMQSEAVAINAAGDVAGSVIQPGGTPRAVLWRGGKLVDLKVPDNGRGSIGLDVNGPGQVVGTIGFDTVNTTGALARGFVWSNGSSAVLDDLVTDKSWHILVASAINDKGEIVGLGYRLDASGAVQVNGVLLQPTSPPSGSVAASYTVMRSGAPLPGGTSPRAALRALLQGRRGLRLAP